MDIVDLFRPPTSASAKPPRGIAWTNGSGGGCVPSPGRNGSADAPVTQSCDAAASAGTWQRRPLAAHMALGGSATVPRSPSPCPTPLSSRSAYLPSRSKRPVNPPNRRIRTRMYGGWEGRSREAPYPDLLDDWKVGTALRPFSEGAWRRAPGIPRPACGERATRHLGKPEFGAVRGRFRRLRLAERPPHPTFSPHAGRRSERALRP